MSTVTIGAPGLSTRTLKNPTKVREYCIGPEPEKGTRPRANMDSVDEINTMISKIAPSEWVTITVSHDMWRTVELCVQTLAVEVIAAQTGKLTHDYDAITTALDTPVSTDPTRFQRLVVGALRNYTFTEDGCVCVQSATGPKLRVVHGERFIPPAIVPVSGAWGRFHRRLRDSILLKFITDARTPAAAALAASRYSQQGKKHLDASSKLKTAGMGLRRSPSMENLCKKAEEVVAETEKRVDWLAEQQRDIKDHNRRMKDVW